MNYCILCSEEHDELVVTKERLNIDVSNWISGYQWNRLKRRITK